MRFENRVVAALLALAVGATVALPLLPAAGHAHGGTHGRQALRHVSAGHCEGGPASRLAVWPDPDRPGIVGRIRIAGAEPGAEWTVEYRIVRRLAGGESVSRDVLALATADDRGTAVVAFSDRTDSRHRITVHAGAADGGAGCWAWASLRFAR